MTTPIPEVTVQELEALSDGGEAFTLLDVRNPDEYKSSNLGGLLIPITELPDRLGELDPQKQIIVHCHAGGRSRRACEFLIKQGFKNVSNLKGGLSTWLDEVGPARPVGRARG